MLIDLWLYRTALSAIPLRQACRKRPETPVLPSWRVDPISFHEGRPLTKPVSACRRPKLPPWDFAVRHRRLAAQLLVRLASLSCRCRQIRDPRNKPPVGTRQRVRGITAVQAQRRQPPLEMTNEGVPGTRKRTRSRAKARQTSARR